MKILSPRVHGFLDYGVVALLLLAPSLFGFAGVPATICYVLAVTQAAMSLLTAYPLGLAKILPFSIHGAIEALTSVFVLASPWIFGFAENYAARNFFIASAVGLGVVWLVTDYRSSYASTTSHGVRYGSERHSFS